MAFSCQRCRRSLDIDVSRAVGQRLPPPGDSYLVLSQPRPLEGSSTLSDLSDGLRHGEPVVQATQVHEQLLTAGRLLDLSERAKSLECGVPLCDDCLASVQSALQRRLDEAVAEKQLLQAAFAELEVGEEEAEELISDEAFAREMELQEREEDSLRSELDAARRDREALAQELRRLEQVSHEQQRQHEARFVTLNAAELERQGHVEESLRTAQLVAYCEREVGRLERIEVLDDLFRISTDGPIGSINGLRLGRLVGMSVEWTEINAAIGQLVLLLHTISHVREIKLTAYRLVPMGSFSKVAADLASRSFAFNTRHTLVTARFCVVTQIYKLEEPRTAYELHYSGLQIGRFLGGGRFDRGLAMLLACTAEVLAFASRRPRGGLSGRPPHAIEDDCVGGYPIRVINQSEETWTCAFKCLLANLKWLVAWHGAKD